MKDNAIIALADSNYFEMLEELIDSINKHPKSKNVSICVLDAGLTVEQIKSIEKKVYKVKKANGDIEVSNYKVIGKEWLKSQVSIVAVHSSYHSKMLSSIESHSLKVDDLILLQYSI